MTAGIRDYSAAQALADAGVTEIASHAGGRARRVCFEHRDGGDIAARLFQTDIVTWHADGTVTVNLMGPNPEGQGFPGAPARVMFATPSTFDGIAAALDIARAGVGMVKKVPYVLGANLSTGSAVLDAATGDEVAR